MTFKFQSYWETQNPRFEKWRIATRKMEEHDNDEEAIQGGERKKGGEKGEGDRRKKRKKEHAKTEKEEGKGQGRVQARQRQSETETPNTHALGPNHSGSPRDRPVHVHACDFTALASSAPKRDHEKKSVHVETRALGENAVCPWVSTCPCAVTPGYRLSASVYKARLSLGMPLPLDRSFVFEPEVPVCVTNEDCSSHAL